MTSASDGALRELVGLEDAADRSFQTVSEFYDAVKATFPEDWIGHPLRKDYPVGRIPVQFKGVENAR